MPLFSLVARSFEPALDHHEGAGHGEAGACPEQDPGRPVDDQTGGQRDDGARGGEGAEGAHVTDPAHQPRRQQAPADEAARPGGAEQPQRRRREAFLLAAQRHQKAEQARRGKQERGAAQQGKDRTVGCEHFAGQSSWERGRRSITAAVSHGCPPPVRSSSAK